MGMVVKVPAMIASFVFFLILVFAGPSPVSVAGGSWKLLQENIGVSAMHMQLMKNDRVVIFDRTDFGPSNLTLPEGKCRIDANDTVLPVDCTAHSVEYDVVSNTFRALMVQTDLWCSAGAVMADGRLVQTGGFNDGERKVRIFNPCPGCDWEEIDSGLAVRRWYPTNHILPDSRQIIVGGRKQFNYEFYPKDAATQNATFLPFLAETNDLVAENNLYPFVFLNVDGNLFIFANNRAILFNYLKNVVVKTFPEIPGGDPRSYPSTGSAVLLPLKNLQAPSIDAEVLICGGAPKGSFTNAANDIFIGALNTCARIKITDPDSQWVVETMPLPRVMGDMIVLPNGHVLIINGGSRGTAGWELGRDPVFEPVIYRPDNNPGTRFELQNRSPIPRMYHSAAVLLRDGRVLVGGSNPHTYYNFTGVLFPTDLSLEAFSPPYLDPELFHIRPEITFPASQTMLGYSQKIQVRFSVSGIVTLNRVTVTMLAPPFTTHSFSMNQRLLVIGGEKVINVGTTVYEVEATVPRSGELAPAGYYLLYVVHEDIPSVGIWVAIK